MDGSGLWPLPSIPFRVGAPANAEAMEALKRPFPGGFRPENPAEGTDGALWAAVNCPIPWKFC